VSIFSIWSGDAVAATNRDSEKVAPETPMRERVREKLEQLIVEGVLKPGEHLVELDVAERLGVSRGPIREAFHQLHLAGWIDLRPRYGAFVHAPSREEVVHFFDVRVVLETESARLAARKAEPADVERLRNQIDKARQSVTGGDEDYLSKASELFHRTVAEIGGNPVLTELVELIGRRVRWYTKPVLARQADEAWAQHAALADVIAAHDVAAAGELMAVHVNRTRTAWLAKEDAPQ
jgi:DNA-binding GntR family transcriptional regulator